MKHKRLLALLIVLAICVVTLTVPAYAEPDETETAAPEIVTPVNEKPPTPSTSEAAAENPTEGTGEPEPVTGAPTAETPTESQTEPAPAETSTPEVVPTADETNAPADAPRSRFRLTPDGQLTLIDDFEYVGMDADGNTLSKQFLTVETRDGHYFYIIIDRIGDTENVYFLNQVDAADLTAITQIEPTSRDSEYKAPTKTDPTPAKEADDPIPTEEPTEPKTEPDEPSAQQSKLKAYLSLAAIVLIGAGAGVYFLIRRKKSSGQKQKQPEYDLDEDEELEIEPDDGEEEPDDKGEEKDPDEEDDE